MPQLNEEQAKELQAILEPLGDQRAKDLIDRNDGEDDPRRAIKRLHRALSYGRTSIQAGKAYQDLGMYYEELGNTRLALKYYTEAIAVKRELGIEPVPALFWRGKLYLERGDAADARRDFAEAIELEGVNSWFPEERELAERTVAEGQASSSET
jgi:tetratricopeptide (TPR) repeat protein